MASKSVGMVMSHHHKKVVIVRTGLSIGDADAVMIAPLSRTKPSGSTPCVKVKTWYDDYWVPLDQVTVVKVAEVVYAWTPPARLTRDPLNAVLKELDKLSR